MTVKTELLAIQQRDKDRMLHPATCVAWAREHRDSELYRRLEWDDSVAAEEYRIDQVRKLISVHVVYDSRAPMMVSLTIDRQQGGGYRTIEDVNAIPDLKAIMLRDALNDLERAKTKYRRITQLAGVWEELERAKAESEREAKRKAPVRKSTRPKAKEAKRKAPARKTTRRKNGE